MVRIDVKGEVDLHFQKIKLMTEYRMDWRRDQRRKQEH